MFEVGSEVVVYSGTSTISVSCDVASLESITSMGLPHLIQRTSMCM